MPSSNPLIVPVSYPQTPSVPGVPGLYLPPSAVNTTACKRPFSLGCVAHTDGAALQYETAVGLGIACVTLSQRLALPEFHRQELRLVSVAGRSTKPLRRANFVDQF